MTNVAITTVSGMAVEIEVGEYLNQPYLSRVTVPAKSIDSRADARLQLVSVMPPAYRAKVPAGVSHVLHLVNGAVIGLGPGAVATLEAAITVKRAEINERPEVKLEHLITERQALVSHMSALLVEASDVVSDAHDSERTDALSSAYAKSRQYVAEAEALKAQIDEWDAAHPEVVAEIQRRADEAVARNLWN